MLPRDPAEDACCAFMLWILTTARAMPAASETCTQIRELYLDSSQTCESPLRLLAMLLARPWPAVRQVILCTGSKLQENVICLIALPCG